MTRKATLQKLDIIYLSAIWFATNAPFKTTAFCNTHHNIFDRKSTRVCRFHSQVKELNHVLEAEKSCRTDLEMYVAVLNTQKSVLQEDAEKLRKELHDGTLFYFLSKPFDKRKTLGCVQVKLSKLCFCKISQQSCRALFRHQVHFFQMLIVRAAVSLSMLIL